MREWLSPPARRAYGAGGRRCHCVRQDPGMGDEARFPGRPARICRHRHLTSKTKLVGCYAQFSTWPRPM
jgi:hypothetical protein